MNEIGFGQSDSKAVLQMKKLLIVHIDSTPAAV